MKIYSTPACPHCKAAKNYFKSLGISFEDVDVLNQV
ncbi:MAG: glutaredoxin family protein [Athalassotoga sp.]